MRIWNVLGIEPTDNKKEIKTAYREKLRTINPEDHPEEFMELRDAYEKVLKDADQVKESEESEAEEKIGMEQWKEKIETLYKDNKRRFSIEAWEELFQDEVCYSLDTREEAGNLFFGFFGENIFIARDVLKKAEELFHFTERVEELEENFPYQLIDYFVNYRLKEEEYPCYRYFDLNPVAGADYDDFLEEFRNLCSACEEEKYEQAEKILEKLDATGISHPSLEVKRILVHQKDEKKVNDIFTKIEALWGDVDEALYTKGEWLLAKGNSKEAELCLKKVLELDENYSNAVVLLAFALKDQEKYGEAREILIRQENPQINMEFSGLIDELDCLSIEKHEKIQKERALEEEEMYDLAMAYLRKNCIEYAKKTMEPLREKPEWQVKCLRMDAIMFAHENEWEESLPAVEALIQKLEAAEKTEDYKRYLSDAYMLLGQMKLEQKQRQAGLDALAKSREISGNKEACLLQDVFLILKFQFYGVAAELLTELNTKNPRYLLYRFLRGMCYYHMDELQMAHEDFEYMCMMEEDNLLAHIYLMRVYLKAGAQEEMEEVLRFFDEKGFATDCVRLMQGMYQEYLCNYKSAIRIYEEIIKNYNPENSDLEHIGEVYLHIALCNIELDKRGIVIFRQLDKGIEAEPTYIPLLEKRAELNEAFEDSEAVEKDLKEILKLNPYHEWANSKIADFLEESGQMEKAAEYMDMRLQADESPEAYLDKALNMVRRGEFESAWENICLAEAKAPETLHVYVMKAIYYSLIGENEKAIEFYTLANEENVENNYHQEIASCYCHMGDYDAAFRQYERLCEAGEKTLAYDAMFELQLERGLYEQAQALLKKWHSSRKKFFKGDEYRIRAARLHIAKREYKKAFEYLDMAEVTMDQARELLGGVFLYEGKTQKALKKYAAGIKEWPENINNYYQAAIAELILGKTEDAKMYAKAGLRQLKKDQEIGGGLKDFYKQKGSLYSLLGEYEQAQECFEKALNVPMCVNCQACQCHEVYIRMAVMYHLMGQTEKYNQMLGTARKIKPDDMDLLGLEKLIELKMF